MQFLVTELTNILDSMVSHLRCENESLKGKDHPRLEGFYERKAVLTGIFQEVLEKISNPHFVASLDSEERLNIRTKMDNLDKEIKLNTEILERSQYTNTILLNFFKDALSNNTSYKPNGKMDHGSSISLSLNQRE